METSGFGGLLVGGAAFGAIASCWSYIQSFFWRAFSLFVQRVKLNEADKQAVVEYLLANYKISKLYDQEFGISCLASYRARRYVHIGYEMVGHNSLIFYTKWHIPFLFSTSGKADPEPNDGTPRTSNNERSGTSGDKSEKSKFFITFIRGTIDIDKIVAGAADVKNKNSNLIAINREDQPNRFHIKFIAQKQERIEGGQAFVSMGMEAWWRQKANRIIYHDSKDFDIPAGQSTQALNFLVFPPRIKDCIDEIKLWVKSKDWYQERGIPWKRGWLLYGPPGTGKSGLAKALAQDLNLPLYVFNLNGMTNAVFTREWRHLAGNSPCIALIEDIDNIFDGRKNLTGNLHAGMQMFMGGGKGHQDPDAPTSSNDLLNYDTFLNLLDGVERNEGVCVIITTNNLDRIDPALGIPRQKPDGTVEIISTRPGRIDKAIELTYMEPRDKIVLAERIAKDCPPVLEALLEEIARCPELEETPAQFQEKCAQMAIKYYWSIKEKTPHSTDSMILVAKATDWDSITEFDEDGREVSDDYNPNVNLDLAPEAEWYTGRK